MSFLKITEELLNETLTENGDKTYNSTLSPCLDYFSLVGGKRYYVSECAPLFARAFFEDRNTALKLLLYTRDIKKGLGERRIFRFLINGLALSYPDIATKLVPYIVEYGRYDDLLALLYTPAEDAVIDLIQDQLEKDLENKKTGKPISLLAKWLPSINTSNSDARMMAKHIATRLNLSNADYRKTLSYLRKDTIIENNLREKSYDFDYAKVPSVALNKYRQAFSRNDEERFNQYLEDVAEGKKDMKVDVLDVVNFIRQIKKLMQDGATENRDYFEITWNKIVGESKINKRTLVVRDGSGSMTLNDALSIADAMCLLTAQRLEGEFHDKFITFSSKPELVNLSKSTSIIDRVHYLESFDDCSNTDIQKVYDLILGVYKSPNFKKEDAIEQLLIVSDMQFDMCHTRANNKQLMSTFEYFDAEFMKLGYQRPEIVYWNVESRQNNVPVTQNELGVKLISGSSKNIIDMVTNNASIDPLDFMNKILLTYSFIDELFPKE